MDTMKVTKEEVKKKVSDLKKDSKKYKLLLTYFVYRDTDCFNPKKQILLPINTEVQQTHIIKMEEYGFEKRHIGEKIKEGFPIIMHYQPDVFDKAVREIFS